MVHPMEEKTLGTKRYQLEKGVVHVYIGSRKESA